MNDKFKMPEEFNLNEFIKNMRALAKVRIKDEIRSEYGIDPDEEIEEDDFSIVSEEDEKVLMLENLIGLFDMDLEYLTNTPLFREVDGELEFDFEEFSAWCLSSNRDIEGFLNGIKVQIKSFMQGEVDLPDKDIK